MRRSTPREATPPQTPVDRPIDVQIYTCKELVYEIKYVGSKRRRLYFECFYASWSISKPVTFEEALDVCQLHAVKNAYFENRRSPVKPLVQQPSKAQLTKQAYDRISTASLDSLDTFLEFTAPCGLHDLGMDFGPGMW